MNVTSSIHRRDVRLQVLWPPQQFVGHLSVDNATDTRAACAQPCVYFLLDSIQLLYAVLQILLLSRVFLKIILKCNATTAVHSPPNTIIITNGTGHLVQTRVSTGTKWYSKSHRAHSQASITDTSTPKLYFRAINLIFTTRLARVPWWYGIIYNNNGISLLFLSVPVVFSRSILVRILNVHNFTKLTLLQIMIWRQKWS